MNRRRQYGFTLIEMVVAFAILGLSLTVLYEAFESGLLRARRDEHLREGTLIAQSLLSRVGSEWPLKDGTQTGDSNGYAYVVSEQTVTAIVNERPYSLPTIRIVASVSWHEFAGAQTISIATLKLLPPSL